MKRGQSPRLRQASPGRKEPLDDALGRLHRGLVRAHDGPVWDLGGGRLGVLGQLCGCRRHLASPAGRRLAPARPGLPPPRVQQRSSNDVEYVRRGKRLPRHVHAGVGALRRGKMCMLMRRKRRVYLLDRR